MDVVVVVAEEMERTRGRSRPATAHVAFSTKSTAENSRARGGKVTYPEVLKKPQK